MVQSRLGSGVINLYKKMVVAVPREVPSNVTGHLQGSVWRLEGTRPNVFVSGPEKFNGIVLIPDVMIFLINVLFYERSF